MVKKKIQNGDPVTPGERIGVIEEYVPGKGTLEEEGIIYAIATGVANIDLKEREISIKPSFQVSKLRKGELVLANVVEVQRNLCFVDIFRSEDRELPRPFGGVIHIGEISSRYIDRLSDAFAPGDLIRARVIAGNTSPIFLSTSELNLGVLMGSCVKCGGKLQLEKGRLVCPLCRHSERRKTAKDYGQPTLNVLYPATSAK
jgi:exosome complex component CSL4